MRRRILITTLFFGVLFIALPLALLTWITYSENGLAFALRHLPRKIANTELTIEGVRGTLASGLQVALVEIEHPRSHLRFERV